MIRCWCLFAAVLQFSMFQGILTNPLKKAEKTSTTGIEILLRLFLKHDMKIDDLTKDVESLRQNQNTLKTNDAMDKSLGELQSKINSDIKNVSNQIAEQLNSIPFEGVARPCH